MHKERLVLVIAAAMLAACVSTQRPASSSCTETPQYEIRRSALLGSSRLLPVYMDGNLYGQRLVKLDAQSPLATAGLRPEDTIVKVAGVRVDAPEPSAFLWCKLGAGETLDLDIERAPGSWLHILVPPAA